MKIGVYGHKGYLGNYVVRILRAAGFDVTCLDRSFLPNSFQFEIILDASVPKEVFDRKIVNEYLALINQRIWKSNSYYIYFGTKSNDIRAKSKYSMIKREVEEVVKFHGGHIVRFGLIVDSDCPGGKYAELLNRSQKIPFNIILPPNWCDVATTNLEDLTKTLLHVCRYLPSNTEIEVKCSVRSLSDLTFNSKKRISIKMSEKLTKIIFFMVMKSNFKSLDSLKSIGFKNAD